MSGIGADRRIAGGRKAAGCAILCGIRLALGKPSLARKGCDDTDRASGRDARGVLSRGKSHTSARPCLVPDCGYGEREGVPPKREPTSRRQSRAHIPQPRRGLCWSERRGAPSRHGARSNASAEPLTASRAYWRGDAEMHPYKNERAPGEAP
jgi:hypothetical protein